MNSQKKCQGSVPDVVGAFGNQKGTPTLDVFLEPTCPFSARVYGKLNAIEDAMAAESLTVRIWLHSQPWHMFSGLICRAIAAASAQDPTGQSARAVMSTLFKNRKSYEFDAHCRGENLDTTPRQLLTRLSEESGVDFWRAFDQEDLQHEIKRHTKFARQNGIHVSPSVMVNGLLAQDLSSGDTVETWVKTIKDLLS